MLPVIGLLGAIIVIYAVIDVYYNKRKEDKGICKTTGESCTSPTGCSCGDAFENQGQ